MNLININLVSIIMAVCISFVAISTQHPSTAWFLILPFVLCVIDKVSERFSVGLIGREDDEYYEDE